jgi:purine catabolism regulator
MVKTVLQLTIRDILQRPLFNKAEAFASEEALNRVVRWAHIMEITQVGQLLNGHELILSTGIGWYNDEALSVSFLRQLIDCGASGLCIELGIYTKKPFEKMKALAQKENFPLIFFHEEVRYIDITLDLHSFFINQHHKMVSELESLSSQLNQLLLSGKGIPPLLKLLHQTTGAQVAFFPLDAEPHFSPIMPKIKADTLYNEWITGDILKIPERKKAVTYRPILALDHLFADLLLCSKGELSEFDVLSLDRCATAVAQEMMRTKYMEERKRYKEDLWIIDWLHGKHTQKDVRDYINSIKGTIKLVSCTACVFEIPKELLETSEFESVLIQKYMVARSIFKSEGFYLLPTFIDKQIIFILLDQFNHSNSMERITNAIQRIQKTMDIQEQPLFSALMGIGKEVLDLTKLQESYISAKETIEIQKDIGPLPKPFYSQLHVHRIISNIKKNGQLPAFIEEYIGPIIKYDLENTGPLLKTLKTYLNHFGSKLDAANELLIVRQTLYHRLDKIAVLLGDDYMHPQKRISIELALYSYEYLHGVI